MTLLAEVQALRHDLERLAWAADGATVTRRYALRRPPPSRLSLYGRMRRLIGKALRNLGFFIDPWLPGLKHVDYGDDAKPFLIWALNTDRDTLHDACAGFQALHPSLPGWVPVLVTDVADFAFFSRLGWLVEYVPHLSVPASGYAERKRRYLAWRYRDVPALPASAGLRGDVLLQEFLIG